jgi:hypothetical protein
MQQEIARFWAIYKLSTKKSIPIQSRIGKTLSKKIARMVELDMKQLPISRRKGHNK